MDAPYFAPCNNDDCDIDGIPNDQYDNQDPDNDGRPNYMDDDSDGDDINNDGIPNNSGSTNKGRLFYGLLIGMIAPVSQPLNSNYDANIFAAFDYRYFLINRFNFKAQAGILQLTAEPVNTTPLSRWIYASASGEFDLTVSPNWSSYLSVGAGLYVPKTGALNAGLTAGFGFHSVEFQNRQFDLGLNYHYIAEDVASQLITLHIGMRIHGKKKIKK